MKKFILIFISFFFFITFVTAQKPKTTAVKPETKDISQKKKGNSTTIDSIIYTTRADSIIAFAKKYLGVKYCYGGTNAKSGFDCAGFVSFVYGHFRIRLPRTADAQELLGKAVKRKEAQPGDLIFFRGSNKRNKAVGHSGIVVENADGKLKFISATVSAGIHIDDLDEAYWKDRFVSIRRILINGKECDD
jgi:cell wall-associated NlpC family hydrolase